MIFSRKLCINILVEPGTQSCAVAQMNQVETRKTCLFMNAKKFERSFSVVSFYMQLYT